MQQLYWGKTSKLDFRQHQNTVNSLKLHLREIRDKCAHQRLELQKLISLYDTDDGDSLIDQAFYQQNKSLSLNCSDMMMNFAGKIIQASIDALVQKPPCDFQAVAIGSLPKGEATPYSDLEYLFLVEKKTEMTVRYFENLAMTSYFLIGNLGETKLSYMAIDELQGWFDDQAKNGFKIDGLADGAGNIPTGNGTKTKNNHFIATPEELAKRYSDILHNPQEEALRGDLTAMLAYTRAFFSFHWKGNDLLQRFRDAIAVEVPSEERKSMNLKMLQSDVTKFNFVPNDDLITKGFNANVKKELYRYPSILLLDISILVGKDADTSWGTLEELMDKDRLSKDMGEALAFCLAAVVYIRLSAYLFHDSHDDRVSVAEEFGGNGGATEKKHRRWFLPTGLFSKLWEHLLPLKYSLSEFGGHVTLARLKTLSFTTTKTWSKVVAKFFSGRPAEALKTLIQECGEAALLQDPVATLLYHFESDNTQTHSFIVYVISEVLFWCGKVPAALKLYTYELLSGLRDSRDRMARCWHHLGNPDKAIEILLPVTREPNQHRNIPFYSRIHYTIATAYNDTPKLSKAEHHYILAIQTEQGTQEHDLTTDYYGNPIPHSSPVAQSRCADLTHFSPEKRLMQIKNLTPNTVICMSALGGLYLDQKKHKHAEAYLRKALHSMYELFGENSTVPVIITTLDNLGRLCKKLQLYAEAIEYFDRAIDICEQKWQGKNTKERARALSHLAETYHVMPNPEAKEKAIGLYHKSVDQMRDILASECDYKDERLNLNLGITLYNLGHVYEENGKLKASEKHYLDSIDCFNQSAWPEIVAGDMADTLLNLGNLYKDMGQADRAYVTLSRAVSRHKKLKRCAGIAEALFNMAMNCSMNSHEYYRAKELLHMSLTLFKKDKDVDPVQHIAKTYVQIGIVCDLKGERRESREALSKAKEICWMLEPKNVLLMMIHAYMKQPGPL